MKIFPRSIILILQSNKSARALEYFIELAVYWANFYGNNLIFVL